jgi:hypothetical protein
MTITPNTKVYVCEHLEKVRKIEPDIKSYVQIYAGESVRFDLCRLCSTMALGVLLSSRIKEAFRPEIVNEPRDYL